MRSWLDFWGEESASHALICWLGWYPIHHPIYKLFHEFTDWGLVVLVLGYSSSRWTFLFRGQRWTSRAQPRSLPNKMCHQHLAVTQWENSSASIGSPSQSSAWPAWSWACHWRRTSSGISGTDLDSWPWCHFVMWNTKYPTTYNEGCISKIRTNSHFVV